MTPRTPSQPRANNGSRPGKGAPYTARGAGETNNISDIPGKRASTPECKESFDLPRLKGVHSTTAALKQDAINHKNKWQPCPKVGPSPEKLLTLADELWRLAEDQKNAGEPEPWAPDARTRNIREQLLRMSEALGDMPARPATHGGERSSEDAPTRPTTPLSTEASRLRQELMESQTKVSALEAQRQADPNMEAARLKDELIDNKARLANLEATSQNVSIGENVRLRRALEEHQAKVLKMEKSLIAHIAAREKRKARELWLRQYGIMGRLLLNDTMGALLVCSGWSNQVANDRCDRQLETARQARKQLAAKLRERTFGLAQQQSEVTRLSITFSTWVALVEEAKGLTGTKQLSMLVRKRIPMVIAKWYDLSDLADLSECIMVWRAAMGEVCAHVEATEKIKRADEEGQQLKQQLLDKFGEKAMAQSNRKINEMNASRCAEVLGIWIKHFDEVRAERKIQEERIRQKAEAAATRAKAVQLAMGCSSGQLVQELWQIWKEYFIGSKAVAKSGRRKDQAMKSATRDIMRSEEAFRKAVFSGWASEVQAEKMRGKLGSIQAQMTMVANARKRAIAMIDNRHKKSLEELLPVIFFSWAHAKEIAAARQEAMTKATRGIAQGAEMLMGMGFMAWAKLAGDDREINQERGRRRRMAEQSRAIVIKLRKRLQARVAFDGWLIRSMM